ncbi:DUF4214 domain-containing protein [Thauera aromatica]|nr:DUF4214 domain-containing protein [Thauera aromatica]MCK2126664.1 DUF4214 domain-containing protein [Thauera aromatica]
MAAADFHTQVNSMFLVYFGRPPAQGGLDYYAGLLDANGGDTAVLLDDFYNSQESQSLYGATSDIEAQVTQVFQQAFGRDPLPDGLAYWTSMVQSGEIALVEMAYTVTHNAAPADLAVVQHKIDAGELFTEMMAEAGIAFSTPESLQAARLFSSAVTADMATESLGELVSSAITLTETAVNNPQVIAALAGGGSLVDLLATPAGAQNPLGLVKLVTNAAVAANGQASALDALLGEGGSLSGYIDSLPEGSALEEVATTIKEDGLAAGAEIVQPQPGGGTTPGGGGGGGGSSTPTFTVTEGGAAGGTGTVTFSNATGAVTLTINNDGYLVFTDAKPTAKTSAYKIADMAVASIPAVTMSAATLATANLAGKLTDGTVTLTTVTTNQTDVTTHIAKIKDGGIAAITYADDAAVEANKVAIADDAIAADSITLTNGAISTSQVATLANITKFKADQVTAITFADDAAVHAAATAVADDAIAADSITLTAGAITTAQTEVLANITKFKANSVTAITFADDAAVHAAATAVADDAIAADSITLTAGAITTAQTEVLANITKFKANSVTAITFADDAAVHAAATAVADDAIAADSITLTAGAITTAKAEVVANITKFKADQVTAITLNKSEANTLLGDDALKAKSVTLSEAVDATFLTDNAADFGQLADNSVTALTLANDAEVEAAKLAIASSAVAADSITLTAGAISTSQVATLANITKFKANAVTAITFADDAAVEAAKVAIADDAIAADSITLTNGAISTSQVATLANITKFKADQVTAITFADDAAVEAAKLAIADDAVKADSITLTNGAISTSLVATLANITKFKANQITEITFADDTALQAAATAVADDAINDGAIKLTDGAITTAKAMVLAKLDKFAADAVTSITLAESEATADNLSKAALKNGSVTIGDVTDTSKTAVLAALGKIAADGISSITLTGEQFKDATTANAAALAAGSVTITGDVASGDETTAVTTHYAKIAAGGISGEISLVLADYANVVGKVAADSNAITLDATGIDQSGADSLPANLGKIKAITGLSSGVTLSATAALLTGKSIAGDGTVAVTALHGTGNADLSGITANAVTVAVSDDATFSGKLGKAAVTIDTGKALQLSTGTEVGTAASFAVNGTLNLDHSLATGSLTNTVTGDGTILVEGGTGDQTIDLSGLTTTSFAGHILLSGGDGADSLTANDYGTILRGGAGDDSLTGRDGTDVFMFEASNNGVDTITGFTAGSTNGDILNVGAILGGGSVYQESSAPKVVDGSASGGIALADIASKVVLVSVSDISGTFDEAALFASNKPFAAEDTTALDIVLVIGETSGTDGVKVYHVKDGTEADDMTVTQIASLVGISLADFNLGNFAFDTV